MLTRTLHSADCSYQPASKQTTLNFYDVVINETAKWRSEGWGGHVNVSNPEPDLRGLKLISPIRARALSTLILRSN